MNIIFRYIYVFASLILISSCSSKDEVDQEEKRQSCNSYLIETGYFLISDIIQKESVMRNLGVPESDFKNFCVGQLKKQDGNPCYLAMPGDGRMDGHYTDCPYELLR